MLSATRPFGASAYSMLASNRSVPDFGGGVHGEAAAAVEANSAGTAALEGHLVDVVARRLGRQRAEHGQGHIDAVEAVGIILAAPARGGAAHGVLGVLHAGRKFHQVAVIAFRGHASNRISVEPIGQRGAAAQSDSLADDDEFLDFRCGRGFKFDPHGGCLVQHHRGGHRALCPVRRLESSRGRCPAATGAANSGPLRRSWPCGRVA